MQFKYLITAVYFLLFPALTFAGAKTFSLGNIQSIGEDGAWDAMENPANLSSQKKTHSIFAASGLSYATYTDNSLGMKDSDIYKHFNSVQAQFSLAYAYKGILPGLEAAIAIGSMGNQEIENNSYTKFSDSGTYYSKNSFSSGKTLYDTAYSNKALSISPAASYTLMETYHFGLSLQNYIGSYKYYLNENSDNSSNYIFDQFSSSDSFQYTFSPVLGFVYKEKDSPGEMGIKYTPFEIFSYDRNEEKAVQYFSAGQAFSTSKAYHFDESHTSPGKVSLGISDVLVDKVFIFNKLLFFAEGRIVLPFSYQYQRIEFINNSTSVSMEKQIIEYKIDTNAGLSIGLSAELNTKMKVSLGFSYDNILAYETLKDTQNKSNLNFEETTITGKKYLLTGGYSYKIISDIELVANLGFYQNLFHSDTGIQNKSGGAIEHKKYLYRTDGFILQLAYLQNL